jgi:hypothetical protein
VRSCGDGVTAEELWLVADWPFVRDHLPPAPARVVEIGCGPLGGFVPQVLELGHEAVGVDPQAPAAPHYRRVPFELYESPYQVDAVIASTSLHHVGDVHQSSTGSHRRCSRVVR